MCARYTLRKQSLTEVAAALDAETPLSDEGQYKPRYNVAPAEIGWVVSHAADGRILRRARWKYRIGANRTLVNIRSESVVFPRFRDAFASNRCVVVTDGFFLWPGDDVNPVWFHLADDGLLLLGGLLQPSKVSNGYPRFSVLTTQSNAAIARFHGRMPVIVALNQLDQWLTAAPEAAEKTLEPSAVRGLVATRVSDYVNDIKHDDPGCIAPPSDERDGSEPG